MRERKKGIKDIEKLHELIDSASLPKQKTPSTYDEEKLEVLRKRLSDRSLKDRKQVFSSDGMQTKTDSLTPRVVLHKKEEVTKKDDKVITKKDDKVIQIDLGPREIKKEKEPLVKFVPVQEDPFSKEMIYEIEKAPLDKEELIVIKSKEKPKKTETSKGFLPSILALKRKENQPPKSQSTTTKTIFKKSLDQEEGKIQEMLPQKAQPLEVKQTNPPSFSQQPTGDTPSFEPVEFVAETTEKKQLKPLRGEINDEEYQKQKRIEDKQEKEEEKKKEQEEKRRAKEQQKKLQREEVEIKRKLQEEQKQKDSEMKQTIAHAKEKEQQEKHLLKEQKEKERQENVEQQHKQKQEQKRKKLQEKQARLELKEKKREAKRLAREHDRKLKLEWIEFRHTQQKGQKSKELEQKKAAIQAREKEQDEKHLLKKREEKIRLEHIALLKKEKEEQKQKKIKEKQAKLKAKEEQREARRLAKEQEMKRKMEQWQAQQKQQEEKKTEKITKKHAEVKAKQKEEKQRPLKEQTEKSQLEQIEKEKEKEIQKIRKVKKEKKTPAFTSILDKKKTTEHHTELPQAGQQKKKISFTKESAVEKTEPDATTWESFEQDAPGRTDRRISIFTKKEPASDTQKSLLTIKQQEQKRLEKEQKEKERKERLEQKKKLKEQKIQKNLEEKQRNELLSKMKQDKQKLRQKKIEEKLAIKEAKEKERKEQRLFKEEQKKKDFGDALKESQAKEKEKDEQKLKQVAEKKDRHGISLLGIGKAKDMGVIDERKKVEKQKSTMELVRIAAEEKDLRKTKTFERKMEKERKKKEREERKFNIKEEEKAKKKMDVHMQENIIKEKLTKQSDRTDPFVAFDSIDQETAALLSNVGYTSVEKLRQATVKDLVKIGMKKKNAQTIIAECEEFVEWEVIDAADHF